MTGVGCLVAAGILVWVLGGCGTEAGNRSGSNPTASPSGSGSEPFAHFSAFPTTGYVPCDVQFTDRSLGHASWWEWDFDGDGEVDSTSQNPRFTYAEPGTYTVTLRAGGREGVSTKTREHYLQFELPPFGADFGSSSRKSDDGLVVQFIDQSAGYVTNWEWDVDGDGGIDSREQSPTYTYEHYGTYTVSLTITTPDGQDTEAKPDYVIYAPAPTAAFEASFTAGEIPATVQYTDMSTGDIERWEWDLDGDGVVDSTLQNPEHTYTWPGKYSVSLMVTGPGGTDTVRKEDYLELVPPPGSQTCRADFSSDVGKYSVQVDGVYVQFTDNSIGYVTERTWDFGDGTPLDSSPNPLHLYHKNGTYTVTLTVGGPACQTPSVITREVAIAGCPT